MAFRIVTEKSIIRKRLFDSNLLQYAKENRDEGFFNDVTVTAGSKSIAANRMVLSCQSKYFEKMFKSSFKERYSNTVEIQGAQENAVKDIIDYFYSERIEINGDTVMDLLAASDYLQVDDVKQFCFDFLQSNISPQNCFLILNAANTYRNNKLIDQIHQFIGQHFDSIIQTKEFQLLSKTQFITCLSKLDQKQVKQMSIYQALITWIKHDKTRREKEFVELFQQLIDINKLSIMFVENALLNERLITDNVDCHKLVLTAFSKLLREKSASFSQPSFTQVISLGGRSTGQKVCDVYNSQGKALQTYPDLPEKIRLACSLKINDNVFSIGGDASDTYISQPTRNIWRLNLKAAERQWSPIALMIEKRCVMGAAVYRNGLVVAGGHNGLQSTNSAEFYQISSNRWTSISSMKQPRSHHQLVSSDDYLLVLGGRNDFENFSSSVIKLRDLNGEWEDLNPMQTPRKCFAAVNCNNIVYAIGGLISLRKSTKSVEKYDALADAWSFVNEMNNERFEHSACVMNGKIIVVGGFDDIGNCVKEIECYDPSNNTWSIVGRTNDGFASHSIVATEE